MTPYQQAIIRVAQTVFITLLITGFLAAYFLPKQPQTFEIMECSYLSYPFRWHCVTSTVTINALEQHNQETQSYSAPSQ